MICCAEADADDAEVVDSDPKAEANTVLVKEQKQVGEVTWGTLSDYVKAGGQFSMEES